MPRERDRASPARDIARSARPADAVKARYRSACWCKPLLREEMTDRATAISLGMPARVPARVGVGTAMRPTVLVHQRRADRRENIAGQEQGDGVLVRGRFHRALRSSIASDTPGKAVVRAWCSGGGTPVVLQYAILTGCVGLQDAIPLYTFFLNPNDSSRSQTKSCAIVLIAATGVA